jgi:hypothetical protein
MSMTPPGDAPRTHAAAEPEVGKQSDGLRSVLLVRHAPVTALLIMIGVCMTGFVVFRHQPSGLVSVMPLLVAIGVFVLRAREP